MPFGTTCELCRDRLPWSAAATSRRREPEVKRSDRRDDSWYISGQTDRIIVAHKSCLDRYYTPPATFKCSDCGLDVPSADLGLTALSLWSARPAAVFSCPQCGSVRSLGAQCKWAGKALYTESFLHTPYGAPPCMRPIYEFQIGPRGIGHGQHVAQEAVQAGAAVAVQVKASADKAFRAKLKKDQAPETIWLGGANGGVLGLVIGFFAGCTTRPVSLDMGTVLGTAFVCCLLGAGIGYAISQSGE